MAGTAEELLASPSKWNRSTWAESGYMSATEIVQQIINALSLGTTYALLALGLAMVFAIVGIVNFAHGELVALTAYSMYGCNVLGAPFWAQCIAALLVATIAAAIMERLAFRPFRGRPS